MKSENEPLVLGWRELSNLLRRPVAFYPLFAEVAGGAAAGLFLSQAYYWTNVQDEINANAEGWFYKTQTEWELETKLTRREQETARKQLRTRGLIEELRQGVPAKLYYRINRAGLMRAIQARFERLEQGSAETPVQYGANEQSSMAESAKQDCQKAPNKNGAFPQTLTESTPESTQRETTAILKNPKADNGTASDPRLQAARTVLASLNAAARAMLQREAAASGHSLEATVARFHDYEVAKEIKRLRGNTPASE